MEVIYIIGIYKITNIINNKSYIGQSTNIERRFKEHCYKGYRSRIMLDIAIKKYGKENFTFEVIEECEPDKLNERETYWIKYYDTVESGYNSSYGGDFQSRGSNNGRALITEEDVVNIRIAYNQHKRRKDIYENYKDIITFGNFAGIWDGRTWRHIMPEVYTEENKRYYSREATNGEKSYKAKFTNDEVLQCRQRYVNETAQQIYQDFKDRCKYQSFQHILCGRSYKDLPIYLKKEKKWINL